MKLRTKFLLSFVLIILILVLTIATVLYNVSVNTIKNNTASYSRFLIDQIGINLEKRTSDIEELAFEVFRLSNLDQVPIQESDDHTGSVLRSKDIADYLSNLLYSQPYIVRAAYIEPNGAPRHIGKTLDSDLAGIGLDRVDIERVKQMRGKAIWVPGSEGTLLMFKSLYGLTTGAYVGTVVLGIESNQIENIYTEINRLTSSNILILNEDHQIMNSGGIVPELAAFFMDNHFYLHRDSSTHSFQWNNTNYLYTVLSTSSDKWSIVQIISVDELTRGTSVIKYWTIHITIIALIAAFLLAAFLSKSITSNVRLLLHSMTIFTMDFSHRIIVPRNRDEVGLLAEKFNLMADKISELVNTVYKEKLLKQKAEYRTLQFEYKALQAQINPHFLYNTLESIYALAKLKGEEQIGELIYLLGSLLRESIGKKGDTIPLREELDFIRDYLTIHQIIYEDKIAVCYELDERWMDCVVPKFILQPLVENAIKHGIEEKPGKGTIRIACRSEGETLILEVTDNGIGMDEATIDKVMNPGNDPGLPVKDKHTRVGIISVHKRIGILYGGEYGLSIRSVPGEYTTILIRLPIMRGEERDEKESDRH
ncbi:sensor histidine kinase [Paenibacillus antri]|uniref:Sensor histidine kinase n=1 Tax=Paenibacillus antri TaxID=2582848 RepID=A0A5R9GDR5_9BACL|nr:sensor histidine kinase [Paenibacillus antri]TLS53901.1 sensor histidine kinase [Paenibacillus antri]